MSNYWILDGNDKEAQGQFSESYSALIGPDGFRCLLTEPEDREWFRDLSPVVDRLNEQGERLAELERQLAELQEGEEESERIAESYRQELFRCQRALDMRCIDKPDTVGCTDLLWSVADEITKQLTGRAKERMGILTVLYVDHPTSVAKLCDEHLDPSGKLLGEVRGAVEDAVHNTTNKE